MAYAEGTEVSVERSKGELKRVVYRYGAANYKYAEEEDRAMVMFARDARIVRFVIEFPPPGSPMFTKTPTGRPRTGAAAYKEYGAEHRRRWRALILAIKAKFEVVESGIASFEKEFLPYILLPNGQTVAEAALPTVEEMYATGKVGSARLIPEMTG